MASSVATPRTARRNDLEADAPLAEPVDSFCALVSPLARGALRRQNPRQEPDAVALPVRICAGGGPNPVELRAVSTAISKPVQCPSFGQHPVCWTPAARQCYAFLTKNISAGVWYLLCWRRLGLPCSAAQRWKSAVRPWFGGATGVVNPRRPCSTAWFAKTWLPSRRSAGGYPSGELPSSSAPSLSATWAAGCSATALPRFAASAAAVAASCCLRIMGWFSVTKINAKPKSGRMPLKNIFSPISYHPIKSATPSAQHNGDTPMPCAGHRRIGSLRAGMGKGAARSRRPCTYAQ